MDQKDVFWIDIEMPDGKPLRYTFMNETALAAEVTLED